MLIMPQRNYDPTSNKLNSASVLQSPPKKETKDKVSSTKSLQNFNLNSFNSNTKDNSNNNYIKNNDNDKEEDLGCCSWFTSLFKRKK